MSYMYGSVADSLSGVRGGWVPIVVDLGQTAGSWKDPYWRWDPVKEVKEDLGEDVVWYGRH